MTDAIQGVSAGSMMSMNRPPSLSESQKETLQEILGRYDLENLSEADFKAINDEMREAGIRPSPEVGAIMEEAGVDMGQFMKAPPSGDPPPGPPPGAGGPQGMQEGLESLLAQAEEDEDDDLASLVEALLAKLEDGTLTPQDHEQLQSYLQANGQKNGSFLDVKA